MNGRAAIVVVVLVVALAAAGALMWQSSQRGAVRGAGAVAVRTPAGAAVGRAAGLAAGPIYEVKDGRVRIPEFDDGRTSPTPRVKLAPEDFESPAKVYRGRVIVGMQPLVTKPFTVPTEAKECVVRARSPQILDVFPRIRVSLAADDGQSTVVLCERLVSHVTLQDIRCPMPPEAKKMFMGRIVIEQADKCFASGWRSPFVAGVEFY